MKNILSDCKKNTDQYYLELFSQFTDSIDNKPFKQDFVTFIKKRSIKELILLFLKCTEFKSSNMSGTDNLELARYRVLLRSKPKIEKEEREKYICLLDKYTSIGIKDPERARMLLNAEINRRMQNRMIIFSFIPAVLAIAISIVTIFRNNDLNFNRHLIKHQMRYQEKLEIKLQSLDNEIQVINNKIKNKSSTNKTK